MNTALQSVYFDTKPKRTVVCNQSSNYAKTLKGEYSAAISLPWYEPKRTVVCNQSSHYVKTLKVNTAPRGNMADLKPEP